MDVIAAILREIVAFFKTAGKYLFQSIGAVAALVATDKIQTSADIRFYSEIFVLLYGLSLVPVRVFYRKKSWSIAYAKQFFSFIYWFLTIISAIFAPFVLVFVPFLNLAGLVPKLAIVVLIVILLAFIGVWLRLMDIFKGIEDRMIARYDKLIATPDYEAILKGEEFEHHPEPTLTKRDRLRKWWEERKRRAKTVTIKNA